MPMSKERYEEVKEMVLTLLRSKERPQCASMREIRKELQKLYPDKYPNMVELHEIKYDPEFDFLKAGIYLTGILAEDTLCIKGHAEDFIPATPTKVYERTEEIYKEVTTIKSELLRVKGLMENTREVVEDTYYDVQKIKRKLGIGGEEA